MNFVLGPCTISWNAGSVDASIFDTHLMIIYEVCEKNAVFWVFEFFKKWVLRDLANTNKQVAYYIRDQRKYGAFYEGLPETLTLSWWKIDEMNEMFTFSIFSTF